MQSIDYVIEFVNPKYVEQYGDMFGYLTAEDGIEPYAAVRKSIGGWIRDNQRSGVTGGAVPKFRFTHLVVNGVQIVGIVNPDKPFWCMHCERVAPVRVDIDGDRECSICGAGEWDLRRWQGEYESGRIYEMYSPEFMRAVADLGS